MNLSLEVAWTRLHSMILSLIAALPNLVIGLLVFLLFLGLSRTVAALVHKVALRSDHANGIALVFSRIATWGVMTVGILISLTVIIPGLNASALFGALGVSGVAIGFAFKDIFQNLLAGVLILLTRPFRIGDQIVSGPHEGTVEDIQVRATLLRTYDNRQIVIPNSELYTNRVVVNTAYDRRRLNVTIRIGYGDDLEEARAVILKALDGLPEVRQDPSPAVLVREFDDFSVILEVRFWINPPIRREAVLAEDQVLSAIKPALIHAGINIPYPTRQLLFYDRTSELEAEGKEGAQTQPERPDASRLRKFSQSMARSSDLDASREHEMDKSAAPKGSES